MIFKKKDKFVSRNLIASLFPSLTPLDTPQLPDPKSKTGPNKLF